jgi:hypothetical protein
MCAPKNREVKPVGDFALRRLAIVPIEGPPENGPQIDHRNPVNGCELTCLNATENADFYWDLRAD